MILVLELADSIDDVRQVQPILAALMHDGVDEMVTRLHVAVEDKERAVLEVVKG